MVWGGGNNRIMTVLTLKNLFQADISTLAAGTELIAHACIVYEITIIGDASDSVLSFSDSVTSYSSSDRVTKARTTAEGQTVQLVYPQGKKFSTGVCATSNLALADVAITYK